MSKCYKCHLLTAPMSQSHQSEAEWSSQPGDFPEEAEDAQCCGFKLVVEEEGYEADSESDPEDSEPRDDGKYHGSACDSVCQSGY